MHHRMGFDMHPSVGPNWGVTLLPIVALGAVLLLAALVFLLGTGRTRPYTLAALCLLPVLGLAAAVVLPALDRVQHAPATRVEAEQRRPAMIEVQPERIERSRHGAGEISAPVEASGSVGVTGVTSSEEAEIEGLLRAVGRALGRAIAEAKKNAAVAAVAAGPDAPPATPVSAEPSPERPEWVEADADRDAEGHFQMPISVGPYSTRTECEEALPDKLREAVDEYVATSIGREARGAVRLPLTYIEEHLVQDRWEEWKSYEAPLGKMAKLHVLLEFDREANVRLEEAWNRAVVGRRLWGVGAAGAAMFLLLSIAWAYLKTDLATGGAYRGRLRLGAGAAVVVLGFSGLVAIDAIKKML